MTYFHEEMEFVHRRKTKEQAENREKNSNVEKSQLCYFPLNFPLTWIKSVSFKDFPKKFTTIKKIIFLSFGQKKHEIIIKS